MSEHSTLHTPEKRGPSPDKFVVFLVMLGLVGTIAWEHSRITRLIDNNRSAVSQANVASLAERLNDAEQSLKALQGDFSNRFVLATDYEAGQNALSNRIDQVNKQNPIIDSAQLAAVSERLDGLETDIKSLKERPVSQVVAVPKTKAQTQPIRRKAPQPVVLTPPFQVIGIEYRGGEQFLAVAPSGTTGLDQITLIRPGDSVQSWTLRELGGSTAQFQVNGTQQVIAVR